MLKCLLICSAYNVASLPKILTLVAALEFQLEKGFCSDPPRKQKTMMSSQQHNLPNQIHLRNFLFHHSILKAAAQQIKICHDPLKDSLYIYSVSPTIPSIYLHYIYRKKRIKHPSSRRCWPASGLQTRWSGHGKPFQGSEYIFSLHVQANQLSLNIR